MRIISQLKEDFPYDKIVVYVDEDRVMGRAIPDLEGKICILGEYVDNERAVEVFSEINDYYNNYSTDGCYQNAVFNMPDD